MLVDLLFATLIKLNDWQRNATLRSTDEREEKTHTRHCLHTFICGRSKFAYQFDSIKRIDFNKISINIKIAFVCTIEMGSLKTWHFLIRQVVHIFIYIGCKTNDKKVMIKWYIKSNHGIKLIRRFFFRFVAKNAELRQNKRNKQLWMNWVWIDNKVCFLREIQSLIYNALFATDAGDSENVIGLHWRRENTFKNSLIHQ